MNTLPKIVGKNQLTNGWKNSFTTKNAETDAM
jgi:hypothetical protein